MIRHSTIKAIINQCIGDVDSSSEDLVQMSPILMGDGAGVERTSEFKGVELSIHVVDVVVEITTHNDRSISILPNDILDDISHSLCPLHMEWFLPWFEVAVKHLHIMLSSCQLYPAELCSQRFDKRQFDLVGCCCPRSPIPLQHCLVGPVVVEEHWCSQLGLIQADKVELILEDEISNDLLLLLTVEASDIEAHHCELLQLCQFTVVSPRLVVSLVCCVIPLVEEGVRLLLSPTILLW